MESNIEMQRLFIDKGISCSEDFCSINLLSLQCLQLYMLIPLYQRLDYALCCGQKIYRSMYINSPRRLTFKMSIETVKRRVNKYILYLKLQLLHVITCILFIYLSSRQMNEHDKNTRTSSFRNCCYLQFLFDAVARGELNCGDWKLPYLITNKIDYGQIAETTSLNARALQRS